MEVGQSGEPASSSSLLVASIASAGAAVLHAAACGVHSDTAVLARIFMLLAVAQGAVAMLGFLRPGKFAIGALVVVNSAAASGWLLTRLTGLSDVPGLEVAERPGVADTAGAILALAAVLSALLAAFDLGPARPRQGLASASIVVAALVVPGMLDVTQHDHPDAGIAAPTADGHEHAPDTPMPAADGDAHAHTTAPATAAPATGPTGSTDPAEAVAPDGHAHAHTPAAEPVGAAAWPRPWDPTAPIDFSGVPGVTPEQQARAEQLAAATLRDLPAFADVTSIPALGYRSIGDSVTGFEHFVNMELIDDDKFLDPAAPEALVYRVDDPADPTARTLVSAMFIASQRPVDDTTIVDFGGPLMQWHVHQNLCWGRDEAGEFVVKGVLVNPGDTCPPGSVNAGGENPMVHVWIAPHECGPFAALEGHGAGQAAVDDAGRVDLCTHDHGPTADTGQAAGSAVPYDPNRPIDLSGTPGVTPEQQAFAENLVADTVRNLPQWSDPAVAEAAGFHSIGDEGTGHEHFIQWDWIDDDVWLDPDFPESLVYEPQPDGSRRLVSAMFMLPSGMPLTDVPDWGGPLMQWHVHGDLCFTADPVAPQVAGTKPVGGTCPAPLVDKHESPMIHVWIVPTRCGPFAALEGVGAGQVAEGETALCDHAHGSF